MSLARLPVAPTTLVVPRYFAPSHWDTLEKCPVKAWLPDDASSTLPDTPEVVVGNLLHRVRSLYVAALYRSETPQPSIEALLEQETAAAERRLGQGGQASIVPLWSAVGRRRWMERVDQLVLWSRTARPARVGGRVTGTRREGTEPTIEESADRFELGEEQTWVSNRLCLRGAPDQAVLAADGAIEINDYKSGHVLDRDGNLLASVVTQLQLYALMAEELDSRRPIRLTVEHRRREVVPWSEEARKSLVARLDAFRQTLRPGQEVGAEELAKVGSHCMGCRNRPRCSRYLATVPEMWINKPTAVRPLPLDAWGAIEQLSMGPTGTSLRLRDPAGRAVRIDGLSDLGGQELPQAGALIYAFNLEASEDVVRHGAQLQPINFHEKAPGPAWRDALQAKFFEGPRAGQL